MKKMDQMISDILTREGGYTNNPDDRGGPTNFGIIQSDLSEYLGRPASVKEVKELKESVARIIYETKYYMKPGINRLPKLIQPFIFDCSVNHGPGRAIKFIQSVCNQAGFQPNLDEDGIIGKNTLDAVNWALKEMDDYFYRALVEERRMFYYLIVDHDSSQKVFLKGWLNRVNEFDREVA